MQTNPDLISPGHILHKRRRKAAASIAVSNRWNKDDPKKENAPAGIKCWLSYAKLSKRCTQHQKGRSAQRTMQRDL